MQCNRHQHSATSGEKWWLWAVRWQGGHRIGHPVTLTNVVEGEEQVTKASLAW